ncbi:MAG TPA: hypothetical protein VKU19_20675 [Bryobacteraceae bacterium]|nr:hypothetical protein [Bryobacteraceae bacterium]
MIVKRFVVLLIASGLARIFAQDVSPNPGLLTRRYQEGERLTYKMKATNNNWHYDLRATGLVRRDSTGKYLEEYAWSSLISNGAAVILPPASISFRQMLSLDPDKPPSIPDLSVVHPMLVGPITDLLTFYADLWLATKVGKLTRAGDHFYQKVGVPASWADGDNVVLGEDSIDFDITLTSIDESAKIATLLVQHVPPEQPQVRLPATWMRDPVADTPNNWVQVTRKDGRLVAAVGKETFDVRMEVSIVDGKILSGTIENPVRAKERTCQDAALTKCGDSRPLQILRNIEISRDR